MMPAPCLKFIDIFYFNSKCAIIQYRTAINTVDLCGIIKRRENMDLKVFRQKFFLSYF